MVVKNLPASTGYIKDVGSIPGSERSPGVGNGNALQYSCLGNPMNRGACQATVHGITKRQTQLSDFPHTIYDHGRNFGKYTKEIRKNKQPESLAETLKKRLASYFFPTYCMEIFYDLIIVM